MLLNKASGWVEVYNCLPYAGKVEIAAKTNIRELCVRIPEYVPYGAVTVKRSYYGEVKTISARELSWIKNYFIKLQNIREGEEIEVEFPVVMSKTVETAVDDVFETSWAGQNLKKINNLHQGLFMISLMQRACLPLNKHIRSNPAGRADIFPKVQWNVYNHSSS